jgi:hypothetical protein
MRGNYCVQAGKAAVLVQAKQELNTISGRLKRLEESEFGRVDMKHFVQLMHELQRSDRGQSAIKDLSDRFQVPVESVASLAEYVRLPTIHEAMIEGKPGFVAHWN